MSTLNPTKKVSRRHELREDKVVTFYARALQVYENQRSLVFAVAGGIVVIILLIVGWSFYQANRADQALQAMTTAVQRYENGDYQAAIDGDASFMGLIEIAESYGGTDAGNLARYYAADALFRTGDHERSLEWFQAYDKSADYLGASAFAGEAAIRELNDEHERAGELFQRAATVYPSEITAPGYLMSAARAYKAAGENDRAIEMYERIRDDYPDSQQAQSVDYYIALLTRGG